MKEVAIIRRCIFCKKNHVHLVSYKKFPIFASSGDTESSTESIINKCSNTGEMYSLKIRFPHNSNYEYYSFSLGEEVLISEEKINQFFMKDDNDELDFSERNDYIFLSNPVVFDQHSAVLLIDNHE